MRSSCTFRIVVLLPPAYNVMNCSLKLLGPACYHEGWRKILRAQAPKPYTHDPPASSYTPYMCGCTKFGGSHVKAASSMYEYKHVFAAILALGACLKRGRKRRIVQFFGIKAVSMQAGEINISACCHDLHRASVPYAPKINYTDLV